jgi:hypothetical protein
MNRFRVFALAGLGLLGLSFGSAQAAGWHRTACRPVCPAPVVACAPAPVVTCAPAPCPAPVVTCAPVSTYYPGFRLSYYNRFSCGPRVHYHRYRCR